MKMSTRLIVLLFAVLIAAAAVAQDFGDAQYFRKAVQGGKKSDPVKGSLRVDTSSKALEFVAKGNTTEFIVKPAQIKRLVYERTAKPRYAAGLLIAWPLLFTKSKSHYLTIQYDDDKGEGQYAIVRLDKSNYRDALATVEAQTGKRIDRSEEN